MVAIQNVLSGIPDDHVVTGPADRVFNHNAMRDCKAALYALCVRHYAAAGLGIIQCCGPQVDPRLRTADMLDGIVSTSIPNRLIAGTRNVCPRKRVGIVSRVVVGIGAIHRLQRSNVQSAKTR